MLAPTRVSTPAPVVTGNEATTDPATAAAAADRPSIAVLPFADMSQAQDQEYFSDGLAEEVLNLLAQIRDLKVIGRTSSFAFEGRNEDLRTIGDTLGVAYLLEGSVRKAGDDLRITAQLIQVDDGANLWSQSYDRKLENVFDIQSEIAASIAQALKINLLDGGQGMPVAQVAASLPAYELFLQARRLIHGRTRSGLEAARGLLDQALELDPNYAPALAAKALAVLLLNDQWFGCGDFTLDQAHAIAGPLLDKALALDPMLAETHAAQGQLYFRQRQFERAKAAQTQALLLNPNLSDALHWQAGMLSNGGRLGESLTVRQRLDAFDPLHVANLLGLSNALREAGKLSEARAATARLLRSFPDNPQSFAAQAYDLLAAGRLAEAQASAAQMLALGSNWAALLNSRVYYTLGDFDHMLALQEVTASVARVGLGQLDEAAASARERFASAPGQRGADATLLATLSWTGRFDEALAFYCENWGDLAVLNARSDYSSAVQLIAADPFAALAIAQRELGQKAPLAETLAHWRKRLDFQREQGYASAGFVMTEARCFALAGERVAAVQALTRAIDLGIRDPLLGRDPAYAALRDDPGIKAQATRMIALINIERAKLGMPPLS